MVIRIESTPPTPYGLGWFYTEAINGNATYSVSAKEMPGDNTIHIFKITEADCRRFPDLPKEGYVLVYVGRIRFGERLLFGEIRDDVSDLIRLAITHVALKFRGKIYSLHRPNRHHHIIWEIVETQGVRYVDSEEQGFLDAGGNYLNRKEALIRARETNQLLPHREVIGEHLYSENVWRGSTRVYWNNPWSKESKLPDDGSLDSDWIALPVPIEELVECVSGIGEQWTDCDGSFFIMTKEKMLEHWGQCGRDKLDAYILPHGEAFSIGVRYGNDGYEYYSPLGVKDKVRELYNKYMK